MYPLVVHLPHATKSGGEHRRCSFVFHARWALARCWDVVAEHFQLPAGQRAYVFSLTNARRHAAAGGRLSSDEAALQPLDRMTALRDVRGLKRGDEIVFELVDVLPAHWVEMAMRSAAGAGRRPGARSRGAGAEQPCGRERRETRGGGSGSGGDGGHAGAHAASSQPSGSKCKVQ